jgi:deazaflavin-dependent oxidoreductase (nitroreductase family)
MNYPAKKAVQAATKSNVWLYRRTNGRIGGRGVNGRPLLLLTVAGRGSGRCRPCRLSTSTTVVDIWLSGRAWGSKRTAQWFRNLQAAGRARIRIRERDHEG